MLRTKTVLGLCTAVVVFTGITCAPLVDDLKVGDPAPAFELPGSDGNTSSSSKLKGKTVVIAWFPKAFTGGWTAECKSFRENGDAIRDFDVAYFTASCDPPETNKEFAESLDLDYPILSDPEKKVARAYQVVDEERSVPSRWTFYIGKDGRILHIDKEVHPATSGQDVVERLTALKVARR